MIKVACRYLTFILFIIAISAFISFGDGTDISVSALEESGQCGKNVTWSYDSETYTVTFKNY